MRRANTPWSITSRARRIPRFHSTGCESFSRGKHTRRSLGRYGKSLSLVDLRAVSALETTTASARSTCRTTLPFTPAKNPGCSPCKDLHSQAESLSPSPTARQIRFQVMFSATDAFCFRRDILSAPKQSPSCIPSTPTVAGSSLIAVITAALVTPDVNRVQVTSSSSLGAVSQDLPQLELSNFR